MTPFRTLPWVAFFLLTACPPRPVNFGPAGEPATVEDLLARVKVAESQVFAVKGEAKLKVTSPRGNGSAGLFVAVMHPALIHLEAIDFFGRPQAVLVTDGTTFKLYDAQQSRFFRGPATAQNLSRLLPLALPPDELAALLLGRVPRLDTADASMRFDQRAGHFVVALKKDAVVQTIEVEPPSYRVVKSSFTGVDTYTVELGDIETTGALDFPKKAALRSTTAATSIELNYKDLELNPEADLTMFDLEPPENIPLVEVDGQGIER